MVGRRRTAARDGQELQPKEINKALGFVRNACSTFAWPSPHLFTQLPPDASNSFDLSLLLSLRFFLFSSFPVVFGPFHHVPPPPNCRWMAVGHSIATNPADLFLNAKRALTPGLTFSTKRGETKIFITNVEKTWFSVISMEKSWKFETRVK